jgi:hypothetical protein
VKIKIKENKVRKTTPKHGRVVKHIDRKKESKKYPSLEKNDV